MYSPCLSDRVVATMFPSVSRRVSKTSGNGVSPTSSLSVSLKTVPEMDPTGVGVGASLGKALGSLLGEALGEALGMALGEALGEELGMALGESLGDELGSELGWELGESLGAALGSSSTNVINGIPPNAVTSTETTLGFPPSLSLTSTKPSGFVSTTVYGPGATSWKANLPAGSVVVVATVFPVASTRAISTCLIPTSPLPLLSISSFTIPETVRPLSSTKVLVVLSPEPTLTEIEFGSPPSESETSRKPSGLVCTTVYVPGSTPLKLYFPCESVLAVATSFPSESKSSTVTPGTPASGFPSLSVSSSTTPETVFSISSRKILSVLSPEVTSI
mmetsp:Transcript_12771/g.18331  ORF Transcript_12771/g.18331 Transcript_12771/m.18331 type:complete len:333 (+) Transcript_12771:475-1473(+)